jgi:DmsE family decaheme c-type cytochrome
LDVHAQLNLPYHHPIIEGHMNCIQCHDPHGHDIMKRAGTGLAMARRNETCAGCHRDQSRPFVFQHEAMWEGCTICHTPHGSVNQKLLLQRDNNLCLRCHSQVLLGQPTLAIGKVDHTSLIPGRTCWSAGCHPSVHGSNINGKFQY